MTTTTAQVESAGTAVDEPRPWGPEDQQHVRRLERAPRRQGRRPTELVTDVRFDGETASWLMAESRSRGVTVDEVVRQVVADQRRGTEHSEGARR
jgi:hypothetical protein